MNNPFEQPNGFNPNNQAQEVMALHTRDDVDSSSQAHHHTLGKKSTQAAAGNHEHLDTKWSTGDVKYTYAAADNIYWFELNGQASPTPGLIALFGPNLPDLRDKFIIGAGPAKALGTTGGSLTKTITAAHLPVHTHTIDHDHAAFNSGNNSVGHTHAIDHDHASFTTAAGGSHVHQVDVGGATPGTINTVLQRSSGAVLASIATPVNPSTHTHDIDVPAFVGTSGGNSAAHTHSVDVPAFAGSSGNGGFANNALDVTNSYVALRILVHV